MPLTDLEEECFEALKWALPLAEITLENGRQERLQAGHLDIGAGTEKLGLWPFEVNSMDRARACLRKLAAKRDALREEEAAGHE